MKQRVFFSFIGPSVFMMLLFIALPLASVFWQSFHMTQPVLEVAEVEKCSPGFTGLTCKTETVSRPVLDEFGKIKTETKFIGLDSYRKVLEPERVAAAFAAGTPSDILNIDFWKALRFTLTFTLITLPLVLLFGLSIALVVNNATKRIKGPVIFVSLLPFIITPVVGGLSIRWLFIGDGILTAMLEWMTASNISMFAQAWTIELMMMIYRVWHVAPFAFVVFYAGLQTVNQDTLESAIIDGASRWQRLRYVILPHLAPLITFITLIHLMDAYRVFEEIVAFSSQAYVISLQWMTFDLLMPDDSGGRAISRASASSMLTMIGIIILLIFPLRRSWQASQGR